MRTKKQRRQQVKWRRGPEPWPYRKDVLRLRLPGLTFTWADIVEGIAERCGLQVPEMPPELSNWVFHAQGRSGPFPRMVIGNDTWFEFVPDEMMDALVAAASENLHWTVESRPNGVRLLRFSRSAEGNLSDFEQLAGRLMSQAHYNGRHLAPKEPERIAGELDRAGFKPADHLEGHDRKLLRRWNRTRSIDAIQTFSDALHHGKELHVPTDDGNQSLIPRGAVLKCLIRVRDKYRKHNPHEVKP